VSVGVRVPLNDAVLAGERPRALEMTARCMVGRLLLRGRERIANPSFPHGVNLPVPIGILEAGGLMS